MIKIIAIGNHLLRDDAIGLYVGRALRSRYSMNVIEGEIFYEDCISEIKEGQIIIILDAMNFKDNPGHVRLFTREECETIFHNRIGMHHRSLIDELLLFYNNEFYVIGIQIKEIGYKEGLSDILSTNINKIASHVYAMITTLIKSKVQ